MHVHLDNDQCLETASLKGPAKAVRQFAEKGVRHGQINLVGVGLGDATSMIAVGIGV